MLTGSANSQVFPLRPTLHIPVDPSSFRDLFSDSRYHVRQGPVRTVRCPRATSNGGGAISKSEDGTRCVVAGRESLRILKISDSSQPRDVQPDHKIVVGYGGTRIESSRNFWEGSGLKIDCATTDIVWAHGLFTNKILTSARNGEIIMWDLNKNGVLRYERRTRDHTRSVNKLSYSQIVQHYCLTGSADGDVRIWDLRDMSKSVLRIHHPTGVRTLAFSPNQSNPLHTIVGLDNGSIYRWDLKMGQRGQLDRLPVAHAGPIVALNWFVGSSDREKLPSVSTEGWVATGGLDRCVKIWDFNAISGSNYQPIYSLHTAFPVRRVLWRPSYECELAVVSNADFGTGSNSDLVAGSKMPSPRITERSISGESSLDDIRIQLHQKLRDELSPCPPITQSNGSGDSVEIWDVRCQYIAKWVVKGSPVEGGVTDIAFGDSHSLWAQHSSGAFSQLDLRHAWKPLDAVSSTALSWDVSGALAFVSDSHTPYRIPYDDVDPGKKQFVQDCKIRIKGLGDPVHQPQSQAFGSYIHDWAAEDVEGFIKLARGYVIDGIDRPSICRSNAAVALDAGREESAQIWTLLESLLTDLLPNPIPSLSPLRMNPRLPHSLSTPAVLPSMNSSTSPRSDINKTSPGDANAAAYRSPHISPARHGSAVASNSNIDLGASSYGRPTPTSSATSSPQRAPLNLPSLPTSSTPFPSSTVARKQSNAGLGSNASSTFRPRLSSSLRRPSMSTAGVASDALITAGIRSYADSLKHVGEGALDDSDSSGEEEDDDDGIASSNEDVEEEPSLRPLISPYLFPRNTKSQPSPLSRVVKQHDWLSDDDGDKEASPSPASTDSEGNSSSSAKKRALGHRRRSGPRSSKSRSRSSTVASLAAPSATIRGLSSVRKSLTRQGSHGSTRTVTAGNTSIKEGDSVGLLQEESIREPNGRDKMETAMHSGHKRQFSEAVVSEFVLDDDEGVEENNCGMSLSGKISSRRKEAIEESERRYRQLGWEALQEAFETFAEEGDVQMCAVLAMVAPKELHISQSRSLRFFESYIEILSRLRLHNSAAYLRKHAEPEDIRVKATLQTTIYTSCGRCRKPILIPSGPRRFDKPTGGYSYCLQCQTRISKCSICRLPAKALLFYCAVCMHGGHQKCYREYYTERSMVELPSPTFANQEYKCPDESRDVAAGGSDQTAAADSFPSDQHNRSKIFGHPCAAGCGHYCWAVME